MSTTAIPNTISLRLQAVSRLRKVIDPEIGVNIVDLGLLYQVHPEDNVLRVDITVTTPGCPLRLYIEQQAKHVLSDLAEIELNVVFDPPWSVEMISDVVQLV